MLRAVAQRLKAAMSAAGAFMGLTDASGNRLGIRYVVSQSGLPTGVPSSGSIANNGALTLSTALALTYAGGIYLFYPANAIFAGSTAGLYWTVMSSTTVGTIYQEQWTGGVPVIPAVPTPWATTGPGAYTQVLTEITIRSDDVPANSLGINSVLSMFARLTYSNTAVSKAFALKFGGQTTWNRSRTTSANEAVPVQLQNRGMLNRQIEATNSQNGSAGYAVQGNATPSTYSINTAATQTVVMTATLGAATEYLISENHIIEVTP